MNEYKNCEYRFPVDFLDLRFIVKDYLSKQGRVVKKKFKNNLPSRDCAKLFVDRHSTQLSVRLAANIKRARAEVSKEVGTYCTVLAQKFLTRPLIFLTIYTSLKPL